MPTGLITLLAFSLLANGAAVDDAPRAFEAAAVHFSPADSPWTISALREPTLQARTGQIRGGRYEIHAVTLLDLIASAYSVDPVRLSGGPAWLDTTRFDVIAKVPPGATAAQLPGMLRSLLSERFHLATHSGTGTFPEFVLTAGTRHLLKSTDGGESGCRRLAQSADAGVTCRNVTLAQFAQALTQIAGDYFQGNRLYDRTEITGAFDFNVRWSPRKRFAAPGSEAVPLTAAIGGLGLNLSRADLPEPVLVIDHVDDTPTPDAPGTAQLLPQVAQAFEVAVIRPTASAATRENLRIDPIGRVEIQGATLKSLIKQAWDVQDLDAIDNEEMIAGIPKFAESARYDIIARAPSTGPIDRDSLKLMTRRLLEDRFGLITHTENRPVDVLALVASRTRLQRSNPGSRSGCRNAPPLPSSGVETVPLFSLECRNTTMEQFAHKLQALAGAYVPYPAVDATGLTGGFDFTVSWSPPHLMDNSTPDPNGGISLPDAMERQLGLRLRREKRALQVIVVDHLNEAPTAN